MRREPCYTTEETRLRSRRRFLAAALGAVAGPQVIPASALGKGNRIAPNERIAVGCIGLGNRYVRRGHIDAEPKSLLSSQVGPGEIRLPKTPGHQREFLDCIKSRKQTVSNIDVAVRSDTISHLTDVCTRLRRKVRWNPDTEEILGDADASRMLTRSMRHPWRV